MKHFIEVASRDGEIALIDVSMISYIMSKGTGCDINLIDNASSEYYSHASKESYQDVKEKIIAACALLNTTHLPDRNPSV